MFKAMLKILFPRLRKPSTPINIGMKIIPGQQEAERSTLRRNMFAKWDGKKFVYGREAAELRDKNAERDATIGVEKGIGRKGN